MMLMSAMLTSGPDLVSGGGFSGALASVVCIGSPLPAQRMPRGQGRGTCRPSQSRKSDASRPLMSKNRQR